MNLHERVAARYRLLFAMSYSEALEVLGVPPGASAEEINKAFKRKVLENHPDRGGDPKKMVELNVAKDIIDGKARPSYEAPSYDDAPGGGYSPPPRPKPEPVRVSWEEAEAKANVPKAKWIFKTQNAFGGRGDTSSTAFVVCGELDKEKWVFVAVEHFQSRNPFTGEDIDTYWMKATPFSGALRDVAPKAIRQMFDFPHTGKNFNAKVQILPEGMAFNTKMMFLTSARTVSFKDAMEILGELKEDDPWKNRKLQVEMILNAKDMYGPNAEYKIELVVNGRPHVLDKQSVMFIKDKTKVLPTVYGTYFYWSGDKKNLTKSKNGKKVLEYLAEKLTSEPQSLRDALAAAASQMK